MNSRPNRSGPSVYQFSMLSTSQRCKNYPKSSKFDGRQRVQSPRKGHFQTPGPAVNSRRMQVRRPLNDGEFTEMCPDPKMTVFFEKIIFPTRPKVKRHSPCRCCQSCALFRQNDFASRSRCASSNASSRMSVSCVLTDKSQFY